MWFSKRNGYVSSSKKIQKETLDDVTKNRLWNIICPLFFNECAKFQKTDINIYTALWTELYKYPIDTVPEDHSDPLNQNVRERFYNSYRDFFLHNAKWFECFDFLEFIVAYISSHKVEIYQTGFIRSFDDFIRDLNKVLEEENSAYRFVNEHILETTSKLEIQEIDEALNKVDDPVQNHLEKALHFLSDRKYPDYPNSVKESISAVESLCCIISGNSHTSLGKALDIVKKKYPIHPSLEQALQKLYGYSSDAGGIRHGGIDYTEVDYALAKFMLVTCSSFINYLLSLRKD